MEFYGVLGLKSLKYSDQEFLKIEIQLQLARRVVMQFFGS